MNKLLKEFLSYILAETKRPVGRPYKTTAGWSAKKTDGERPRWFRTRKAAQDWLDGREPIGKKPDTEKTVRKKEPERIDRGWAVTKQAEKDRADAERALRRGGKEIAGTEPSKEKVPSYLDGRSAASEGVISPASEIVVGERKISVRQVLDENGNPIDISTTEGRKAASRRLDERIKQSHKITLEALKDFPKNTPASQWVGEIGEMYALKELLDQDVEVYMAAASNPESDLIKVDRSGPKGLIIVEISAKATKEQGAVGVQGANARAIFSKMGEGKQATIPGIEGPVSAKTAVNIVYDVREKLGGMLTDGMVVEVPGETDRALELSDEELAKCTDEYQALYKQSGARSGGKSVRQNFALYERSRIIQDDDVTKLETQMLSDIDRNKRKTAEEKEREKVIVKHYIERLRKRMVGKPLSDLRQATLDDVGEIYDNTDPPTDLVIDSDLVVIRFNAQTGVPEVKIAKWEDVKNCIDGKENRSRETTVGQAFPDRDVAPALADKPVGDVIDQECQRPDGTTKWRCQFMKYIGHSFKSQARLRSAKGNQPRRGKLQLKLNWSPPTNCVEENLQDSAEYVK